MWLKINRRRRLFFYHRRGNDNRTDARSGTVAEKYVLILNWYSRSELGFFCSKKYQIRTRGFPFSHMCENRTDLIGIFLYFFVRNSRTPFRERIYIGSPTARHWCMYIKPTRPKYAVYKLATGIYVSAVYINLTAHVIYKLATHTYHGNHM